MALFPSDPPPSNIELVINQPSAKGRAINGISTQARSSGIFLFSGKISYSLLEFEQRDQLAAFLISQQGRAGEFDLIIPTHSENSGVTNSTSSPLANHTVGDTVITLTGMVGELTYLNLLRINGQKASYVVTSAGDNVAGEQVVTISPPLRTAFTTGQAMLTKDVPMNVSLSNDSLKIPSSGMSSSFNINFEEEVV